jgi:hypothetical protein
MIETWIKNDPIISKHFGVMDAYVYCKCNFVPKNRFIPVEVLVCRVNTETVVMQQIANNELININHPFSVYKIKSYMFHVHNILSTTCDEHLCQK